MEQQNQPQPATKAQPWQHAMPNPNAKDHGKMNAARALGALILLGIAFGLIGYAFLYLN